MKEMRKHVTTKRDKERLDELISERAQQLGTSLARYMFLEDRIMELSDRMDAYEGRLND